MYTNFISLSGSSTLDPVLGTIKECGYALTKEQGNDVVHVGFSSCHVTVEVGVSMSFCFCSLCVCNQFLCHLSLVLMSLGGQIYSATALC